LLALLVTIESTAENREQNILACLVGLRASEVIQRVNLLNGITCKDNVITNKPYVTSTYYYNPERQALEYFRYPATFMRQIKKAYISFFTEDMLPNGIPIGITYNDVRYACVAAGIKMRYAVRQKDIRVVVKKVWDSTGDNR
jgi:hypothetical protein